MAVSAHPLEERSSRIVSADLHQEAISASLPEEAHPAEDGGRCGIRKGNAGARAVLRRSESNELSGGAARAFRHRERVLSVPVLASCQRQDALAQRLQFAGLS